MAAHSSVLAWRTPGMGEPGGLPSMGLHRVGNDWSDLAAAAYLMMKKFDGLFKVISWECLRKTDYEAISPQRWAESSQRSLKIHRTHESFICLRMWLRWCVLLCDGCRCSLSCLLCGSGFLFSCLSLLFLRHSFSAPFSFFFFPQSWTF